MKKTTVYIYTDTGMYYGSIRIATPPSVHGVGGGTGGRGDNEVASFEKQEIHNNTLKL